MVIVDELEPQPAPQGPAPVVLVQARRGLDGPMRMLLVPAASHREALLALATEGKFTNEPSREHFAAFLTARGFRGYLHPKTGRALIVRSEAMPSATPVNDLAVLDRNTLRRKVREVLAQDRRPQPLKILGLSELVFFFFVGFDPKR